ncbi:MAG: 50S ribosomal protein L10 [Bacteroidales bacterium]|nr:50S ribosomal protein L10 [Fournierella massiliensis]MCF2557526.1 50S ribosomal protein L10 [Fournierella massiliensis]MCI6740963.1 50S ribosomal protein L10 [Bacteroidales bacterium]
MPSAKILSEKQALVADLKAKIDGAAAGVLVSYKGINVADDTKLRKELREAGVEYAVIKNSLIRFAVQGTALEGLSEVLEGTTALAISKDDPIVAANLLNKFAESTKNKEFQIKGGFVEGKLMSKEQMQQIAKLPGREGMLSMFAGALTSTLSGLAVAMQAYVDKQEEPAA